jgi:colanic acid biosynthesis protein WcaH
MPSQPRPPQWLDPDDFERVVRLVPLISIDLIVRSSDQRVLLGRRTQEPARNTLFTVGGRIGKNETRAAAFERIALDELGVRKRIDEGRFHGVYEHLYPANFFGKPGFGTHYIVLAYELPLEISLDQLPRDQHGSFVWKTEAELLVCPEVHEYVKNYFRKPG